MYYHLLILDGKKVKTLYFRLNWCILNPLNNNNNNAATFDVRNNRSELFHSVGKWSVTKKRWTRSNQKFHFLSSQSVQICIVTICSCISYSSREVRNDRSRPMYSPSFPGPSVMSLCPRSGTHQGSRFKWLGTAWCIAIPCEMSTSSSKRPWIIITGHFVFRILSMLG